MTDCRKRSNRTTVLSGDPESDSDPYRGLMRDDRDQIATLRSLQAAVQDGLTSDISYKTLNDIWVETEQRFRSRHG